MNDFDLATTTPTGSDTPLYSVSRLNRLCRFLLSDAFRDVWVEGEISNFTAAASGHFYFTLKDNDAQVRCAMFKPQARLLNHRPKNGDQAILKAQVTLYEPRGDFQLIVETIEESGDGLLAQAFAQLKRKLENEGLFDATHKQAIPGHPRTIGVITSPTGAAIHDILTVLKRRFPVIEVILFPVKVQGAEAATEIVRALEAANRLGNCDVLILGRGGGSMEDLWPFNEEKVARAVFASRLPVISAVGHEIDFTICDFVADLRAPTPSAAAETVSPNRRDLQERVNRLAARLASRLHNRLEHDAQMLRFLDKRLKRQHPAMQLQTQSQRLDDLRSRVERGILQQLQSLEQRLLSRQNRLLRNRLDQRIQLLGARCKQSAQKMDVVFRRQLEHATHRLAQATQQLQAVSPLATLARGYSMTAQADNGQIITHWQGVRAGARIRTRIRDGSLISIVESASPSTD